MIKKMITNIYSLSIYYSVYIIHIINLPVIFNLIEFYFSSYPRSNLATSSNSNNIRI